MATRNEDLRYRLLGEDVSAGRTFSKVGNAAKSAHGAISELGQTLNSTGAFEPFAQGLDAISKGFDHIKENGKSARVIMQGVGVGIAAAGAALLGLGANAQQATAGLKQAIQDAGGVYGDYSKQIEETVAKTATFGRTAGDTEDALARLTTATQDPQRALSLMGLTANIAAARNMNLTDASQLLTTALAGNTRVFRSFGINVGTGKLSADQLNKALDELNRRLSGRAQAQADTFSGRIKGMAVEFENAGEKLTKFAPLLLTVGSAMTIASAGWDLLAKAKARNAAEDLLNVGTAGRAAKAEVTAAAEVAAAGGGTGAIGAAGASGMAGSAFTRGRFLKAGGLAAGGLIAGQVAGSAFGSGRGASMASDALSLAGVGAGIGSIIPGVGTLVGAGVGAGIGAAGGALLGFFHHGSGGDAKLAAFQKQQAKAQIDQATADAQDQWMFAGFDPTGNPKAQKLATATEAYAKAQERLKRAREDLNKVESKSADPAAMAAATSRLTAAEANLRKAQYVGGTARIASAQAAVDSAHARISSLGKGVDATAAARRVADAKQAADDAHKKVAEARKAEGGQSASQFLNAVTGQRISKQREAADVTRLVDRFHIAKPLVEQIAAQGDATLDQVATTMTTGLAKKFNKQAALMKQAAVSYTAALGRALDDPIKALAEQQANNFNITLASNLLGSSALAGLAAVYTGSSSAHVDTLDPRHPKQPQVGAGGIFVQNVNITAKTSKQLQHELTTKARHKALSGQTPIAG